MIDEVVKKKQKKTVALINGIKRNIYNAGLQVTLLLITDCITLNEAVKCVNTRG